MLVASPETLTIRSIVEHLSDEDMRSKGPGDFREAVEAVGLDFRAVRDKINNELARERRRRGIHKGRGRKLSLTDNSTDDKELPRLYRLYCRLDALRQQHGPVSKLRNIIEELLDLLHLVTPEELMVAIQIMEENEDAEQGERRGKH